MNRPIFKRGEDISVTISKMAFGGRGIARLETDEGEIVAFVPNTITGQKVRCRIAKVRKRHLETKLMEVLERSPMEEAIPYQSIPGAPYATLPIATQESVKKQTCLDLFERIGKVENAENYFDGFISSPSHWHYRNKMEYSFAAIRYDLEKNTDVDGFALGFKHRGTWWMVENLDRDSGLFDADFENKLKDIREYCKSSGLPAWHHPKREGFFRFLTVRKSYLNGGLLVNLVTSSNGLETFDLKAFANLLRSFFGDRLKGFLHTVNDDIGDRVQPLEGESQLIFGKDHIEEQLFGLQFKIQMESFFQTNPKSAERLYAKVIDYLETETDATGFILDLFCGTGTIAQLVSSRMENAEVLGIDIVESAIADARRSARENGILNVRFEVADVGKFLLHHPDYRGKIKAVILDPPRGGIAPKALKRVIELEGDTIVYVSCNPATLARDTEVLQNTGYRLKRFSLVDQFPHTGHVEAVSVFKKWKE
jgi:23S rRNA (uracil-5-)-methyltransferase RumA